MESYLIWKTRDTAVRSGQVVPDRVEKSWGTYSVYVGLDRKQPDQTHVHLRLGRQSG